MRELLKRDMFLLLQTSLTAWQNKKYHDIANTAEQVRSMQTWKSRRAQCFGFGDCLPTKDRVVKDDLRPITVSAVTICIATVVLRRNMMSYIMSCTHTHTYLLYICLFLINVHRHIFSNMSVKVHDMCMVLCSWTFLARSSCPVPQEQGRSGRVAMRCLGTPLLKQHGFILSCLPSQRYEYPHIWYACI